MPISWEWRVQRGRREIHRRGLGLRSTITDTDIWGAELNTDKLIPFGNLALTTTRAGQEPQSGAFDRKHYLVNTGSPHRRHSNRSQGLVMTLI